jgi:hypothetical protein
MAPNPAPCDKTAPAPEATRGTPEPFAIYNTVEKIRLVFKFTRNREMSL